MAGLFEMVSVQYVANMENIIHYTHNSRSLRRERRQRWIREVREYGEAFVVVALGILFVAVLFLIAVGLTPQ